MIGKNDAINESLSALLDNEHSELDLRRVLKAAETDESVGDRWASYQLGRHVIKKELDLVCDDSFLSGIQQAIAEEEPHSQKQSFSVWQRYAGKAAVAACFTFVFLIGANQWQPDNQASNQNVQVASDAVVPQEPAAVVPSGFELPPLTARTVSTVPGSDLKSNSYALPVNARVSNQSRPQEVVLSPELQAELRRLMLRHAESSSASGGLGVIPMSRAVGSESPAQ